MTDQEQSVSKNSAAVQSGRDTIIQSGFSASDVQGMLSIFGEQIKTAIMFSQDTVDRRLTDFEKRLTERFFTDSSVNPSAFSDPDFLYAAYQAQLSHARKGDEALRDLLIDLIAQRSKENSPSRLALSLNAAIEKAPLLTKEEYAALSFVYLMRYTVRTTVTNISTLKEYLDSTVLPIARNVSREETSLEYLVSQGCASLSPMMVNLMNILKSAYGGVLCKGFTEQEFAAKIGEKSVAFKSLIIPCLLNPGLKQINALSKGVFFDLVEKLTPSIGQDIVEKAWELQDQKMWAQEEMIDHFRHELPDIGEIFDLWHRTNLKHMTLSPVGIAIAYSNLVRNSDFRAELSIWIK